jgi:hypothetical protein
LLFSSNSDAEQSEAKQGLRSRLEVIVLCEFITAFKALLVIGFANSGWFPTADGSAEDTCFHLIEAFSVLYFDKAMEKN